MRDQILNLLSQGATGEEARSVTGASPDYLAELLKDKGFIEELKEERNKRRAEIVQQGYAKLEQATLGRITKELEYADIPSLCRVLETTQKNRALAANPSGHYTNGSVHLTVEISTPHAAQAQHVIIDQKTNQIVAIGDRNMAGMPVQGVQKLFENIETERKGLKQQKERDIIDADLSEGHQNEQAHEAINETRAA